MTLDYQLRSLLKLNLKLFLDTIFIRSNAFTSVTSGTTFYDGSDMSIFLPDTSADNLYFGLSDGQVWQSAFRQFIYESGVPLDGTNISEPPRAYSGVYIEGSLRRPDDAIFGHTVDYINGRIIFNTAQSLDLKVNADFAYRDVRVGFEHEFNQQFQFGYLESKYTTNPGTSMQLVYPSGRLQPFPAVFIEVDNRDFKAYEMGNRSAIIQDVINLHVWALDDLQRDNIVDTLTAQWHKVLPIIDFNKAPLPLSGIYNTLSNEYIPYQEILKNNTLVTTVGSGTPIRYLVYLDEVRADNLQAEKEYEKSIVRFKVKTYLNAPNTPLTTMFGPISHLPALGDSFF